MNRVKGDAIRLLFLGCGQATAMHARTLRRMRAPVELGFASRDAARAANYLKKFGGIAAEADYEVAIKDPRWDVVMINLPPKFHREWTLKTLEHGKHVIVEKPPFLNLHEVDEVLTAAETGRKFVMVAENYYYKPLLRELRKIVREFADGDLLCFYVNALKTQETGDWRDNKELAGGGALFEGGIHWINFMNHLGLTVRDVRVSFPHVHEGVDRTAVVTYEYEENVTGVLFYSWETYAPLKGLRFSRMYGRRISIIFESNGLFLFSYGRYIRLKFPGFRDIAGYRAMFRDFIDSIRQDHRPAMDLMRARKDMEVLERLYHVLKQSEALDRSPTDDRRGDR